MIQFEIRMMAGFSSLFFCHCYCFLFWGDVITKFGSLSLHRGLTGLLAVPLGLSRIRLLTGLALGFCFVLFLRISSLISRIDSAFMR